MSDDAEKVACPECDEAYQSLGGHWARSKDCDYPPLALSDEAVLDGLMLVGGTLRNRHVDANCYISIVHADRDVLEWVADELGVLAASITEFDQAGSVDYYGADPERPLWEFRTRSLPALDKYYGWYDADGSRTVPEDVSVDPLLLKTACLLAARPMDDRPGLYLSLQRTSPPPVTVHRVFGGYGPRIVRPDEDGYVVRIHNSTDLCQDLAPWPAFATDRFDPEQFDEGRIICPRCGGRFRTGPHVCEHVEDGEVVRVEDAEPGGASEIDEVDGMRARIKHTEDVGARYVYWSREDCVEALRQWFGGREYIPTNPVYERVQRGNDDLPSLSTLYARFGDRESWLEAVGEADGDGPADADGEATDTASPNAFLEVADPPIDSLVALCRAELKRADEQTDARLDAETFDEVADVIDAATVADVLGGGDFADALSVAGVSSGSRTSSRGTSNWSTEECLAAIQRCADEQETDTISANTYSAWASGQDAPSITAIKNRFGSWGAAVDAAGFEVPESRRAELSRIDPSEWTREDILELLRDAADKMGEPLTSSAYRQYRRQRDDPIPSRTYIQQQVDRWNDLLLEAELEPSSRRKTRGATYEDFLDALIEIREEMGEWPSSTEYPDAQPRWAPARGTVYKMDEFEGWPAAVDDAKVRYEREQ